MDVVALLDNCKLKFLIPELFTGLSCEFVPFDLEKYNDHTDKKNKLDISNISLFIFHYQSSVSYLLPRLESLKKTYPSIPIIMTVEKSHAHGSVTRWALRFRMWDCVVLPGELNYLRELIKTVLALVRVKRNLHRLAVFPSDSSIDKSASITDKLFLKIEPALQHISINYDKKVRVSCLANLCNMSKSNFSLQFKSKMGVNLRTYLRDYRINIAKKLLIETSLKINEIAISSGFEDVSQFNRQFKLLVLKTPSEFRH